MKEITLPAIDVKSGDHILFGSELYRVYLSDPDSSYNERHHVEIWLITDRRHDQADKVMIRVFLHRDHPLTVIRAQK